MVYCVACHKICYLSASRPPAAACQMLWNDKHNYAWCSEMHLTVPMWSRITRLFSTLRKAQRQKCREGIWEDLQLRTSKGSLLQFIYNTYNHTKISQEPAGTHVVRHLILKHCTATHCHTNMQKKLQRARRKEKGV